MTVLEMAKRYYPYYWGKDRIDALVAAGRLTKTQAKTVLRGGAEDAGSGGNTAETDQG